MTSNATGDGEKRFIDPYAEEDNEYSRQFKSQFL